MKTPASPNSVAPFTRNVMAKRVFPQPAPPQRSVGRPVGNPPWVIASRPAMPVGDLQSATAAGASPLFAALVTGEGPSIENMASQCPRTICSGRSTLSPVPGVPSTAFFNVVSIKLVSVRLSARAAARARSRRFGSKRNVTVFFTRFRPWQPSRPYLREPYAPPLERFRGRAAGGSAGRDRRSRGEGSAGLPAIISTSLMPATRPLSTCSPAWRIAGCLRRATDAGIG